MILQGRAGKVDDFFSMRMYLLKASMPQWKRFERVELIPDAETPDISADVMYQKIRIRKRICGNFFHQNLSTRK